MPTQPAAIAVLTAYLTSSGERPRRPFEIGGDGGSEPLGDAGDNGEKVIRGDALGGGVAETPADGDGGCPDELETRIRHDAGTGNIPNLGHDKCIAGLQPAPELPDLFFLSAGRGLIHRNCLVHRSTLHFGGEFSGSGNSSVQAQMISSYHPRVAADCQRLS